MYKILFFNIYYIVAQSILELQVNLGDQYITQATLSQIFNLRINEQYDYYMIEIRIQDMNNQNVMLVFQLKDENEFGRILYNKIDNNGYSLQKSYQYLLISNDEINITNSQYVSVFSTSRLIYRISAKGYNFKPCPLNCNNQGSCFQGQCLCLDGWIDEDCSIQATKIQIESNIEISNFSSNLSYAYYETTSDSQNLLLTLETKTESNIQINMIIVNSIYLPSKKYSDKQLILNSSSSPIKLNIEQQNLQDQLNRNQSILVMSFQSLDKANRNDIIQISLNQQIEEEEEEENNSYLIIVIVFPIVFGLLAILLFFCCVKVVRKKLQKKRQTLQVTEGRLQEYEQKGIEVVDGNKGQEFFPIMVQGDLKKINEDQCSICLENWNKQIEVKQTPCGHLFHDDCINMWLQKHAHCPLCRSNLVIQDLQQVKGNKINKRF